MCDIMIIKIPVEDDLKESYLTYAMSVIVSRAIPDVRDGLKPVQRRILYSMYEIGLRYNKPHKKSARVVGEVLGKYHPHGDAAIYDALVRMAQDFSLNYPLVDGQGNFGSVDGDPPAAMRYTEVRLSKIAEEFFKDIEYNTIEWRPNFDNSLKEPVVLPVTFPHLLVNGSSGIAVGMVTEILPHNLGEIIDATIALIDNKDPLDYIQGPDFPTGGVIVNKSQLRQYLETGRGTVKVRASYYIKDHKIIITDIPYQTNKARILEQILDLKDSNKIQGITTILDKSTKQIEIEIGVHKSQDPEEIAQQLIYSTDLSKNYYVRQVALVNGKPVLMGIKEILREWIKFRKEVITKRAHYFIEKWKKRVNIINGLLIAIDNIDFVIETIRNGETIEEIREKLGSIGLNGEQIEAVLNMSLRTLAKTEREKLEKEKKDLEAKIAHQENILKDVEGEIKRELLEIKKNYGRIRRTEVTDETGEYIAKNIVVGIIYGETMIKKVPEFPVGKVGTSGTRYNLGEEIKGAMLARELETLILLTKDGEAIKFSPRQLPMQDRLAKGQYLTKYGIEKPILKILPYRENGELVLLTKQGIIKKVTLRMTRNVLKVIGLNEGDQLLDAQYMTGETITVVSRDGKAARFRSEEVRVMGRSARGVKAMKSDNLLGLATHERVALFTERGFGKVVSQLPIHHRGTSGVKIYNISKRTGELKAICNADQEIVLGNEKTILRLESAKVPELPRTSTGRRITKRVTFARATSE